MAARLGGLGFVWCGGGKENGREGLEQGAVGWLGPGSQVGEGEGGSSPWPPFSWAASPKVQTDTI